MKSINEYITEKLNWKAIKEKIKYSLLLIPSEKKGEAENRLAKMCEEKYNDCEIVLKGAKEVSSTKDNCVNYYVIEYIDKFDEKTKDNIYFACIKKKDEDKYAVCNWEGNNNTETQYYLPKISDINIEHALNYGYDCLIGKLTKDSDNHTDSKYEFE